MLFRSEYDPYARNVLLARQRDGWLPRFPIWDDVRTFDGRPWRGHVDVVSGGFPCQDISCAGKGAGIEGARSGLWREMARIVGEVRPSFVWVENSPILVGRGLAVVLGDLASMGYDARWGIVGAHHAGANHKRDRVWVFAYSNDTICDRFKPGTNLSTGHKTQWSDMAVGTRGGKSNVADADGDRRKTDHGRESVSNEDRNRTPHETGREIIESGTGSVGSLANADGAQRQGMQRPVGVGTQHADACGSGWWQSEPDVGRVAHGVAHRVDRLRCIGNGQVPQAMALAWRILSGP